MKQRTFVLFLFILVLFVACSKIETKSPQNYDNLSEIENETELAAQLKEIQPILEKFDAELISDNLLYNNEIILNQTCCWQEIKKSHNPMRLSLEERYKLFKTCYWIIRPYMVTLKDEVRFVESYYPMTNYNTLLCMHGYSVYQSKIMEQLINGTVYYDDSKTIFSINQIMPDVYTEEELEILFGPNWRDNLYQGGQIMPFGMGSFLIAWGKTQIQLQEKIADIKTQQQMVVAPVMEALDTPVQQQPVNIVTDYDFPQIKMNKQDIYDSFNYNDIVKRILSDYDTMGVYVENSNYTFYLKNGEILHIKEETSQDVDIKIFTNWAELKNMIVLYKEGNTKSGIAAFMKMNIQPWTAKAKAIRKIKL